MSQGMAMTGTVPVRITDRHQTAFDQADLGERDNEVSDILKTCPMPVPSAQRGCSSSGEFEVICIDGTKTHLEAAGLPGQVKGRWATVADMIGVVLCAKGKRFSLLAVYDPDQFGAWILTRDDATAPWQLKYRPGDLEIKRLGGVGYLVNFP